MMKIKILPFLHGHLERWRIKWEEKYLATPVFMTWLLIIATLKT